MPYSINLYGDQEQPFERASRDNRVWPEPNRQFLPKEAKRFIPRQARKVRFGLIADILGSDTDVRSGSDAGSALVGAGRLLLALEADLGASLRRHRTRRISAAATSAAAAGKPSALRH